MNISAAPPAAQPKLLMSHDPRLIDKVSPEFVLNSGVIPMRRNGSVTVCAAPSEAAFSRARAVLEEALGPVAGVPAPLRDIRRALERTHAPTLSLKAVRRTPEVESYRTTSRTRLTMWIAVLLCGAFALALAAPTLFGGLLVLWIALTLISITGLRTFGALVQIRAARALSRNWRTHRAFSVSPDDLPSISLLIPLYREGPIFDALARRLEKLDYPRDRLEVLLILESGDEQTLTAVRACSLPDWFDIIEVPPGELQTKPRALNYAFDFANGEIIGIYDAEDAPAPNQLLHVADAFEALPKNVACLQGILDFYNPRQSWLTRCFTIDYAAWFRLILPGLVRLGFAIPLGGTTVFLRRDVLEKVGRWDAHNVTEDADLGIRLARRGYKTAFIPSITMEEATADVPAWVRQRSRWIKGYAMTWAVHMRRPWRLYNDLGSRAFWGFQILFFGALSQFVLAPLLWSFWLLLFGLPHPITAFASQSVIIALAVLFFFAEIMTISVLALGVATPRHKRLIWWVPIMHLYFPLSAVASWKAFYELLTRPFFWDKTTHGSSLLPNVVTRPMHRPRA